MPSDLTNAVVVSAQALHTLALRSNGTVVAWGYNTLYGETNVPAGLTNVTAISAGYQFNLAVSNGFVVAWGDNSSGQCNVPAGLSNVVDVAAGTFHGVALLKNGTVVAWGDNFWGQTNVPAGLFPGKLAPNLLFLGGKRRRIPGLQAVALAGVCGQAKWARRCGRA